MKRNVVRKIGVRQGITVADLGCGQGGFTAALARAVGAQGKVFAIDVPHEYLTEFMERLDKYDVKNRVTFTRVDAADLKGAIADEVVDMAVSFRLLEELKRPEDMVNVVRSSDHQQRKSLPHGNKYECKE